MAAAALAKIPLKIGIPAATASLAYLDARWSLSYDMMLVHLLVDGVLRGRLRQLRDRLNMFYLFEAYATNKKTADHPFLMYQGKTWTYKQAYETVLKWSAWLKDNMGVTSGEIVAMDAMNSPMFIFLWFALWSLGAKPAFINYNLTGKPLFHCLKVSTSRILLVDDEVRDKFPQDVMDELSSSSFRDGKGPVQTVFLTSSVQSEIDSMRPYRAPDEARSGQQLTDLALLIYTSGTTGLPKPGVVSWQKVVQASIVSWRFVGIKQQDRFYTPMPLYHSTASLLGLGGVLAAGSTFVIGHKFSTKLFWEDVRQHDVTVIQYVGETCRYLLAAPPSPLDNQNNVRIAFGNGLRPDVWNRFKDRFGIEAIAEFYASTEGPSGSWNLSRNEFTRGAIGRNGLLAHFIYMKRHLGRVKIDHETDAPFRDPNTGFCVQVNRDEPGELLYKLDPANITAKFQGYYGNSKATEGKIMRNVFAEGDAYFRSGDTVVYDTEWRWFFKDRIGDTFRWKSENVSTAEVAEVLGAHPAISEPIVYGVELPHHDGRAGCATLVLNDGFVMDDKLAADIAQHALRVLPRFAVPIFLRVTKQAEITGTMKQQKHQLRQQGCDPSKTGPDQLWWLTPGSDKYVPYEPKDWSTINAGQVKL